MKGKSKCKILKDIRKQIAKENDIEFITSECKYQGDCLGTCPKCEAEVRYLEEELKKRKQAGKRIAVAGIAAAFVVGSSSCEIIDSIFTTQGDMAPEMSHETVDGEMPSVSQPVITDDSDDIATKGELIPDESEYWQETPGEAMPEESDITEKWEEMGDVIGPMDEPSTEASEYEIMGDMAPGYYE